MHSHIWAEYWNGIFRWFLDIFGLLFVNNDVFINIIVKVTVWNPSPSKTLMKKNEKSPIGRLPRLEEKFFILTGLQNIMEYLGIYKNIYISEYNII